MSTNEPTITVYDNTPIEDVIKQLDELGLLNHPVEPVYEFRLYYNDDGFIYASASSAKDADSYGLTGDYLVVNKEDFYSHSKYKVKNGKLVEIKSGAITGTQLEKSDTGFEVAKNNAGILLEPGEDLPDTDHYDHKNS